MAQHTPIPPSKETKHRDYLHRTISFTFLSHTISLSLSLCVSLSMSLSVSLLVSLSPPPLSYLVTRPIAELPFMINSLLSRSGFALSVMTVLKVNTQFR